MKAVAPKVRELELFKIKVWQILQKTNLGFGLIPIFGRMVLKSEFFEFLW